MIREIKKERIKKIMRRQGLLKRKKQPVKEMRKKSNSIMEKVFCLDEYRKARTIMFYIAKDGEVETKKMIASALKNKKKVVIPKVRGNDLEVSELLDWNKDLKKGAFGLKEPKESALRPVSLKKIDLLVLPGIVFDLQRNRLGYGAGYFDRFLTKLLRKTKTIALAFDSQIVNAIPHCSHDRICDKIITEKRIIQ